MDGTTPTLALMVGLAVGIDYSLFIVNRQRRMILDQGLSAREAAGRAVGTAGSAVFFCRLNGHLRSVRLASDWNRVCIYDGAGRRS
ncbi:MMPL family transporter [Paenibacillus rhizoplanae]